MIASTDTGLTRDAFLGGKLFLNQPRDGYRAGIDPVLLAASVPAKAGQTVLDLGCGAGAAILCLGTRISDLQMFGLELQARYAALARDNARQAGLPLTVFEGDVSALPQDLRQLNFHHILANPPYFDPARRQKAADQGREQALAETVPLAAWVDAAARRLRPRGYLHIIQRSERLPDLLTATSGRLGSVEVLPLAARTGRAPENILFRARKDGRAPFRLHAPLILHQGTAHLRDADDYAAHISAILRDAAALNWPV